jgi:Squalene-hopene cyclase C-terminal domain
MGINFRICAGLSALCVLAVGGGLVLCDSPKAQAAAPQDRQAVERGLAFLQQDAARWRKEHACATCHHGTMTVWALCEAKSQGYEAAAENLADTVQWTKERLKDIDKPRDTRPGWSMVSTPALYLSVMALSEPKQDALSADELKRIAGHLLRHQEIDGSWAWSSAPAKNRPPPVFESDEVATLLAYLALGPHVPTDPKEKSAARDARESAAAWLAKTKPSDTTQAAALRLLVKVRAGEPARTLPAEIDQFLDRQNKDGGWGQLQGAASDAYATGQALYVLSLAGVKNDRAEVRRGVTFLVDTQKEDGAWPMTARSHPGATPSKNQVPITYLGSAWATIGLIRSVPR